MTTLDLTIKVLMTSLETAEDKEQVLKTAMKTFAADGLNLAEYLREKNLDPEVARGFIERHGIDWNGKTKKFL